MGRRQSHCGHPQGPLTPACLGWMGPDISYTRESAWRELQSKVVSLLRRHTTSFGVSAGCKVRNELLGHPGTRTCLSPAPQLHIPWGRLSSSPAPQVSYARWC